MGVLGDFRPSVGDRFGLWTVTGEAYTAPPPGRRRVIPCRCDCGTERAVFRPSLKDGVSLSCGCRQPGIVTRHGMARTRLYKIWRGMHSRCKPEFAGRKYYYDKGVCVCKEWSQYMPFHSWAMASGYKPHLTIDRINGDGGYSPENCRWADYFQQAQNQKTPSTNTSGVRHVRWAKSSGKWSVDFTIRKKRIHVGCYDDKDEAARVAREAYSKAMLSIPQSS